MVGEWDDMKGGVLRGNEEGSYRDETNARESCIPPIPRIQPHGNRIDSFSISIPGIMACLHRVSFYLAAFFLLQCVTCGLEFRECASEEQAIDWIKDLIEKNEKMDKNLISIVRAPFGCQF